jgi:alpha-tubulin suppressor-like RCC1 family protein
MGVRRQFLVVLSSLVVGCGARSELVEALPVLTAEDASANIPPGHDAGPLRDAASDAITADVDAGADAAVDADADAGPPVAIVAGGSHTLAIRMDRTVVGWGDNDFGYLGNGSYGSVSPPAPVSNLSGVVSLATGGDASCAVLGDGSVHCWGSNATGELGNASWVGPETCELQVYCSPVPGQVADLTHAVSVTVGEEHACALLADGSVWCWGDANDGELGDGSDLGPNECAYDDTCATTPARVPNLTGVLAISAGGLGTCALLSDHTVVCWGATPIGPHACNGTRCALTPVPVPGLDGATAIALGYYGGCAIVAGGAVSCWGDNSVGATGAGSDASSMAATPVPGISGATAISTGADHACALIPGGSIECWGNDYDGELGNGALGTDASVTCLSCGTLGPVQVSDVSGAMGVAAGDDHTCALLGDGGVVCWGNNTWDELGFDFSPDAGMTSGPMMCGAYPCSPTPVPVSL